MSEGITRETAVELTKRWLRSEMTGCQFATRLMVQKTLLLIDLEELFPDYANASLIAADADQAFTIFLLPFLETEESIVDAIITLCENERWQFSLLREEDETYCLIQLEWLTEYGKWSNCVGLAPLLSMPATRRSPVVSIGLWPGNTKPQWPKKIRVGLGDTISPFDEVEKDDDGKTEHDRKIEATEQYILPMFESKADMLFWRKVTFRVRRGAAAKLYETAVT